MSFASDNRAGPLAIMGGAFDPVHYGHLRSAAELLEYLQLAELRFVPSANPPHREPHIAAADIRVTMLEAALAGQQGFSVDQRELGRAGPSWTVVTLEELRTEVGERSLCMVTGMDAFLGLPSWHRWEEVLGLAHIVVACRPGSSLPADGPIGQLLAAHGTDNPADIREAPCGRILVHAVTQLEISSSYIRAQLSEQHSVDFLLPAAVLTIIEQSGCYRSADVFPNQEHRLHAE